MKSSRARKTRTRIRRPKYLSLRLQLSPTADLETPGITVPDDNTKLIDMLPLKQTIGSTRNPPSIEVEKLDHDQSNMAARLFTNMDGCSAVAATLTDILQNKESSVTVDDSSMQQEVVVETEEERGSVSSCWASRSSGGGGTSATSAGSRRGSLLERAALRSSVRREDQDDEEEEEMKWVRMSEVVREEERTGNDEKSGYCRDQEEVSSCVDRRRRDGMGVGESGGKEMGWRWWWPERITISGMREENGGGGGMLLKLDYGEVMNAWGDRGGGGPFCWDFEDGGGGDQDSPQTVPDLQLQQSQSVQTGSVWAVPVDDQHAIHTISGGHQDPINGELLEPYAAQGTKALREASILRYKEKRMNRLFSKRIRYEVRKRNAEKRPRIKGRFVKRD